MAFFTGAEGIGSGIPQAVVQLNGAFTARIEQIKESIPHDVLNLDNDAVAAVLDNWRKVLADYAVRALADGGSPGGLDGLTSENLSLLRGGFWDMNQIASFTETVPKGEDETEIILHIVLKEGVSFRDPGVDYFNGFHRQHKIPGHLKQPQDLYWKLEHPPAT